MTLIDHRDAATWTVAEARPVDHSAVADFLATTPGLAGRKFASDSRDVAEHLEGAAGVSLVRDADGVVRGFAVHREPHGDEVAAEFVFDVDVPTRVVRDVVTVTVDRFHAETTHPGAYLRAILGDDQQAAIDALTRQGAWREAQFRRTRKSLTGEDRDALATAAIPGITVLGWADVEQRGLGEQVRRVQYDTFLEHFGNMSKSPEAFARHVRSRAFTPDFSLAAVDDAGEVVGYVLGSTFTSGAAPHDERSAHTDYIGVRGDHRKRGIGELLLRKVWLAALRRGLTAASLGTDIRNRSNAHLLYERLGYLAVQSQYAYRIDAVQERP